MLIFHSWELVQEYLIWYSGEAGCTVCGSFLDTLKEAMTGRYDLILVDVDSFLGGVMNLAQHAKVVGLTRDSSGDMDKKVQIEGGAGAVWIGGSLGEIESALEKMRKGDPKAWKPLRAYHVAEFGGIGFGKTQLAVLDGVSTGLKNEEIAAKLGLTKLYVDGVVGTLREKTNMSNKTKLALWAKGMMG